MRSSPGVEALDNPAADPALVTRMMRDLARANRWMGGRAAVRFGLARLLDATDRGRRLTLFDIGTGAGDLPLDAARWAARRGVTLVPLALERIVAAARIARGAGVPVVVGCAGALPVRARSVDLVLVSQVAHHLDTESVVTLFTACSRVARRGVLVCDLRPSALFAHGFRAAGRILGFDPTTLDDGVTSLARGFSPARLKELGDRAQRGERPPEVHVATRPLSRIVAWWRTGP
jgi:SAM-dependent methyltransferase